jgi:hypothetical protein
VGKIRVEAERHVRASTDRVYSYLVDYRVHHPAILPSNFQDLTVEEGGVGSGTIFHAQLKSGGRTQTLRMRVSETEPGRVLTETAIDGSSATTFTVTPDGERSRVRIATEYEGETGWMGWLERYLAPIILGRILRKELKLLDAYAVGKAG